APGSRNPQLSDPNTWLPTPPTHDELLALLATLQRQLSVALAKIVELEARLGKNSQNSSKPPSSDQPGTRPPQVRRGKARKRGGQPGHERRCAADPDHVDHVIPYRPATCEHCCADLAKGELTGSVINHYVY